MEKDPNIEEFLIRAALEVQPYGKIAEALGVDRKILTQWEANNKTRYSAVAAVRQLYIRKEITEHSPREFLKWYENAERRCRYCKISEPEIQELIDAKLIHTKRITTRGKKLEIERISPNESYNNMENLVLCCYWCNNAKSDEFSESEFELMAQTMKIIWSGRLNAARSRDQNAAR